MRHTHEGPRYELFYWPSIQGRGEFVRLAFEDAGVPYVDVARLPESEGGGVRRMMALMHGEASGALKPLAPPFLRVGELVVAQTANILHYLGPRLGLVPDDEASRIAALQLQLTIADVVAEAHDTHHPIASSLYYDAQRGEAARRAEHFRKERIPKYLGYFDDAIERRGSAAGWILGDEASYVDLSLFQLMVGLAYAFPNAMARIERKVPRLVALRDRTAARPRVAAYLSSERRRPFSESGIFRRYPELDD